MTNNDNQGPKVEWRWDRFNARKAMTLKWAAKSCVEFNRLTPAAREEMHSQTMREQKQIDQQIVAEIVELLRESAEITGMTYTDRLSQLQLPCIKFRDIHVSWMQDGSVANMKRLAWMLHYYNNEIFMQAIGMTHGQWVEQKIMKTYNIRYVHLNELTINQRTCVHQLYSKKMNDHRSNIMCQHKACTHQSQIRTEQPKTPHPILVNYRRGKTTFFDTEQIETAESWG